MFSRIGIFFSLYLIIRVFLPSGVNKCCLTYGNPRKFWIRDSMLWILISLSVFRIPRITIPYFSFWFPSVSLYVVGFRKRMLLSVVGKLTSLFRFVVWTCTILLKAK